MYILDALYSTGFCGWVDSYVTVVKEGDCVCVEVQPVGSLPSLPMILNAYGAVVELH
jgi:hypothetical protein